MSCSYYLQNMKDFHKMFKYGMTPKEFGINKYKNKNKKVKR